VTTEPLLGRRVLLVEDEALVAMLIGDALSDAGAVVIGPFAAVAPALAAIADMPPELAILDLNLGGESSLPIADDLVARGVPSFSRLAMAMLACRRVIGQAPCWQNLLTRRI